mmetsp:Transcript_22487/g.38345  ORF Transcript_22487/g.38345 Transcript_22487/m.38345 type:complete len:271 (+) Transcript_22487:67-879(+)
MVVLKKGEVCCLAAAALILIFSRHPQPQAAVSAANNDDAMKFSDLFKSDQLSAFLSQFQQQVDSNEGPPAQNVQNQHQQQQSKHHERHRHPNRRMMLYDLSVRSHYERMIEQRGNNKTSADTTTNKDKDAAEESNNSLSKSSSYYNEGLDTSFDVREMIRKDENLFSQFSHWTLKLSRGESLSQIHLEPVPLGDDEKGNSGVEEDGFMGLPPSSLLANDIQFSIPVINNLGTYVDPTAMSQHDFESIVKLAFDGGDEMTNEIGPPQTKRQ